MKYILALILCSQTEQICMPPHQWPELFNNQYDCLMFGYKESQKKMQEIGRAEVNKHGMGKTFNRKVKSELQRGEIPSGVGGKGEKRN